MQIVLVFLMCRAYFPKYMKTNSKQLGSAEIMSTAEGRQYHIGLAPGEVAPFILMCGDPARAEKVARLFDEAKAPIAHREYVTVTGKYKGVPVSIMATGMGPDNTEIAVVELSQVVKNPTFIRIGTSGANKENISNGDLVVSSGAVRLENTSTYFVHEGFPAVASHEAVLALLESVKRTGAKFHLGLTASMPGFYGAQSRTTPFFKPRFKDLPGELATMNVSNNEMEGSSLFTLAAMAGFRAGMVCGIIAERHKNRFISPEGLAKVEMDCIKCGLGAVEVLAKMDKARGSEPYWTPGMLLKA
ncbi:MAG: uridine phosphorylase [Deltaproteobacteria bacterium CG11_big_fil_rev_8_21_14_0_20_49_13]|nr:MAG: uridine phosphorylase [Deltaproteobacteria bacterium CG11_big_fil_rev_8_21_14_0_20_49_13]